MSSDKWQIEEGGEFVPRTSKHPWENRSFWRNKLRVFILQRDPLCRICKRRASEVADHVKPFIAPDGTVSWVLFSDVNNLRGLCAECHNTVTSKYDRGFGNAPKEGKTEFVMPTGSGGREFTSGTISQAKLDEAIGSAADLAALLEGLPE
jgi:hypothetical protein